jgi:hypothetical protein
MDMKDFYKPKFQCFRIVESIIDFSINMTMDISYIFVVDITQCYENIPIRGEDNLGEAIITFFIDKACSQYYKQH